MNKFEDIKSQWQKQPEINGTTNGLEIIYNATSRLKSGQKITNLVLAISVLVLIGFFLYVKAYIEIKASVGLGLMIMALMVRIIIELFSINSLGKLNYNLDLQSFKEKLLDYYKLRIKTHYIATPIILTFYVIGFLFLLPYFKAGLSNGFYVYIKISGAVILIIGLILIFKEAKRELAIIDGLIE